MKRTSPGAGNVIANNGSAATLGKIREEGARSVTAEAPRVAKVTGVTAQTNVIIPKRRNRPKLQNLGCPVMVKI